MNIAFIDLAAQQRRIRGRLDAAIAKVLDHGGYVMGPEVRQFEAELAAFGQAPLALSCANGTDAIALPLMAWGSGRATRSSARPSPSPRRRRSCPGSARRRCSSTC
jgi:dTDP-4-amino-4,6-dideoxygalactose transaminase